MKRIILFVLLLVVNAAFVMADGVRNLPTYTSNMSYSGGGLYQSSSRTLNSYGGGGTMSSAIGAGGQRGVSFSTTSASFSVPSFYHSRVTAVGSAAPQSLVTDDPYMSAGPLRAKPGGATGGGSGSETGGDSPDLKQPIGDAVWPLMLMLLGYVGYARIRRRRSEVEA